MMAAEMISMIWIDCLIVCASALLTFAQMMAVYYNSYFDFDVKIRYAIIIKLLIVILNAYLSTVRYNEIYTKNDDDDDE